jgi:DnaJ-domain-containing protein 1
MSTNPIVRWFPFHPFADRGEYIGLRFEHNPEFAQKLKRLAKSYTWRLPPGEPGLQWLDDDALWCLAPEIGSWVIQDLRARGYTLRKTTKPKRVQDRRPPPPAALDDALSQLRQSGGRMVVRDGRLLVRWGAGKSEPAAVTAAFAAHKPLLTWLLQRAATPSEAPATEPATDPYIVLGVKRGDSLAVIEKAYKALIRAVHPDRIPSDMDPAIVALATSKATAINVAWDRIKAEVGG